MSCWANPLYRKSCSILIRLNQNFKTEILFTSWNFECWKVAPTSKHNSIFVLFENISPIIWGKIYRISYFQLLVKFARTRAIKQLLFDSPNTLRSIESHLALSNFTSTIAKTPKLARDFHWKIYSFNSDKERLIIRFFTEATILLSLIGFSLWNIMF